jgi:PhzF family phenazine biosynthesis protein
MIELPLFQIDAFSKARFGGNPAAVCPLPVMLSSKVLQQLAQENNLSETAFFVGLPESDEADFLLRWFTPGTEVDLCGHATLAAAYVVLTHMKPDWEQVKFSSRSGMLTVQRDGDRFVLDFPALTPKPFRTPDGLGAAMGAEPLEVLKSDKGDRDLLLVYESAETVRSLAPNLEALKAFAPYGFIATAPGGDDDVDFVSRCFFPNHGIAEDPVTGSAHCVSGPYWAKRLNKAELFAKQLSARGGELWLSIKDERIEIAGHAVEYMQGVYYLEE